MKKTSAPKKHRTPRDTMRKEYRFDYSRSKPNRFAEKMSNGVVAVVLDPDAAEVFPDPQSVNNALRALSHIIRDRPSKISSRRSAR